MSPYPFAQAPTTSQLVGIMVDKFGATLETTDSFVGPGGEMVVRYLRREADEGLKASEPQDDDHDG